MKKQIYLAGGCFWGVEKYFSLVPGVLETEAGYANGETPSPSYEDVCTGRSGYAETVRIVYDDEAIGLSQLLGLYFSIIDPTSLNRQGADKGTQYRTGIYFADPGDEAVISGTLTLLDESLDEPNVIECRPLKNFVPAEEYHQKYLDKNPRGYCHIGKRHFEEAAAFGKTLSGGGAKGDGAAETAHAAETAPAETKSLRERLTPMQYEVTQRGATEPPFKNEYFDKFEKGLYVDVTDGTPLFASSDKFESGCGWPSFSRPLSEAVLRELPDFSWGRSRTEVRSQKSGAHLGHVFGDGPAELGGLRYCINSASLRFVPLDKMEAEGYGALIPLVK